MGFKNSSDFEKQLQDNTKLLKKNKSQHSNLLKN